MVMNAKTLCLVVYFAVTLLLVSTVLAAPGAPNKFYGSVTVNGNPAPDGTTVEAKMEIGDLKTVAVTNTINGKYGYESLFYIEDPDNNREGKTIYFYVSGVEAAQAIFTNGISTRLDLSVTIESPPQGNGGTPGGGYTPPSCNENWTCTDWSTCVDGQKVRACTDQNNCKTAIHIPPQIDECVEVPEELPLEGEVTCVPDENTCIGSNLMVCSTEGTEWVKVETCQYGCSAGECNPKPENITEGGVTPNQFDAITGYFAANPVVSLFGVFVVVIIILGLLIYWKAR